MRAMTLLCSTWELPRQLRYRKRAARGLTHLRRAYEHVLIEAVTEGAKAQRQPYYDGYVAALQLLGAKAQIIGRGE